MFYTANIHYIILLILFFALALVEKNAILEELDADYELFKKLSRASPSYRFSYTER